MPVDAQPRQPPRRCWRRQDGYALLIILLMAALLAIGLTAAAPGWITAIQRQREQAAIDYARQYVMGIRRYYQKFGTYPPNLARLKETNGVHYLRRAWKDPLVKSGKWYFIHPDDLIAPKVKGVPGQPTSADSSSPLGATSSSSTPVAPGAAGATGAPGAAGGFGSPGSASGGIGMPGIGGTGGAAGGMAGGMSSVLPQMPGAGATSPTGSPTSALPTTGTRTPTAMNFGLPLVQGGSIRGIEVITGYRLRKQGGSFGNIGGGPIIGVAIPSNKPAVHEFNGEDRPDHWLFIYEPAADRSLGGGTPNAPVAPGSGLPGQTGIPGSGANPSPFGSPSGSPTGTPTGGATGGTGPGGSSGGSGGIFGSGPG